MFLRRSAQERIGGEGARRNRARNGSTNENEEEHGERDTRQEKNTRREDTREGKRIEEMR